MRNFLLFPTFLTIVLFAKTSSAIWCYRCTSATPGCGENFNWRGIGFLGEHCPEDDDFCVKITERKGVSVAITRDCYSSFRGLRTDIPPDHYEGCRQSIQDQKLGNYVNNTVKQYDIHHTYYDATEFCFCFLDHRCNNSNALTKSFSVLFISALLLLICRR